jgi:hypothetical protein
MILKCNLNMKNYKTGVNNNGVRWIYFNEEYQCSYYLGEEMELYAIYKNVNIKFIEELTFYDIFNEHTKVKKNSSIDVGNKSKKE